MVNFSRRTGGLVSWINMYWKRIFSGRGGLFVGFLLLIGSIAGRGWSEQFYQQCQYDTWIRAKTVDVNVCLKFQYRYSDMCK